MPNVVTVNVFNTGNVCVDPLASVCDLPLPVRPVIPMIVFLDMRAAPL